MIVIASWLWSRSHIVLKGWVFNFRRWDLDHSELEKVWIFDFVDTQGSLEWEQWESYWGRRNTCRRISGELLFRCWRRTGQRMESHVLRRPSCYTRRRRALIRRWSCTKECTILWSKESLTRTLRLCWRTWESGLMKGLRGMDQLKRFENFTFCEEKCTFDFMIPFSSIRLCFVVCVCC